MSKNSTKDKAIEVLKYIVNNWPNAQVHTSIVSDVVVITTYLEDFYRIDDYVREGCIWGCWWREVYNDLYDLICIFYAKKRTIVRVKVDPKIADEIIPESEHIF